MIHRPASPWPIALCLALLAAPAAGDEGGLPGPIVPDGLGVNIHFTDPIPGEMDRFAEAGFRRARMDLSWSRVERERGVLDFSAYDRLVEHLARAGARPLFILDYGNPLYDEGQAPRSPEARAAFARFAAAAADRYRGKGVLWEIWNEPNLGQFWKPSPDADAYAQLALATASAIREADPDAVILAPGSSGFPWEFFETIFRAGLLEHIDAVSVHPYRGGPPETAAADFGRLRALIARHAGADRADLPIVSSEWGYSTATGGVSELRQAQYLAREYLANLASGVNLSIFYDWRDDGPDPDEREHRFGTVRRDLSPKPSFLAAKELIASLGGFTYCHRLRGEGAGDWRLLFRRGDDDLALVRWSADPGAPEEQQTPRVRMVEPADPEYPALRRLAAIRFPAGPRAEGSDRPATIEVTVVNPEAMPADVTLSVGEPVAVAARCSVEPGRSESRRVEVPPPPRRDERRSLPIRMEWGGQVLPEVVPMDLWRVDPMRLEAAPSGSDLIAIVENPTGRPFSGALVVSADGRESTSVGVALQAGDDRATVTLPRPGGTHRLALRTPDGAEAAALGPRRFEPLPAFPDRPGEDSGFLMIPFVDNAPQASRPLAAVATPPESPSPVALSFDYAFDRGWRYAMAVPAGRPAIPEGARALSFWIHADGSGDFLRSRFRDATGQTFQVDLPRLTWAGWRLVTLPLDGTGPGTHWGGANDGMVHPPLAWEALALVDSAHRDRPHQGAILIASPSFVIVE